MLPIIYAISKFFGSTVSSIATGFFTEKTAQINATAQVEVAGIEGMAAVETRWWFVAVMIPAFAIPPAIYLGKLYVWDKVFKLGVTDPLSPELSHIMMLIVGGIFLMGIFK